MISDNERRRLWSEYLYTVKRQIEDHHKRTISDAKFAGIIGAKPGTVSKWINAQTTPKDANIDTAVFRLAEYDSANNIGLNPWRIYEQLEMPPRLSTKDGMLLDIVRLWRRIDNPETRQKIYDEFVDKIRVIT